MPQPQEGQQGAPGGKPPKPQPRRPRQARGRRSPSERVQAPEFPMVFRGYERAAVDRYVAKVVQIVSELEATQLRDSVVEQALDEVGEQTAGILQHAHQTAEEIAAQSRAQAEGRRQQAERDAEAIRREADEYAERVEADVGRLREEHVRLVEELRRLADEVLGVADDAYERVPEEAEEEAPEEAAGDAPEAPIDAAQAPAETPDDGGAGVTTELQTPAEPRTPSGE